MRENLLANDSNLADPTSQSEVGSVGVTPFPETQEKILVSSARGTDIRTQTQTLDERGSHEYDMRSTCNGRLWI